jgi:LAS superfamily LD-carboxypeptidase LdcB
MHKDPNKYGYQKYVIPAVIIALAAIGIGYFGYQHYLIDKDANQNIINLESRISNLENENIILADNLQKEQQKNGTFESQIGQIAGTVGMLNKLAKTDKELLQKYSKIYFLNENYTPKGLIEVPKQYVYQPEKIIRVLASTSPFLLQMIDDAEKDGIDLLLISGFRSFSEQSSLKDSYKVVYGIGANKFSADQGYSEHQLGTAVDFTSLKLGANFSSFAKSKEYEWLLSNAYKYGFIISYPQSNTYYQFEPWHWRFVGKKLAQRLHEDGQNFYDLEQRQIDPYLINIFDQ